MPARAIPAQGIAVLVRGYFDPLQASHARQLRDLRGKSDALVVSVEEPQHPLLPWRARAELVAGLASVDYVLSEGDLPGAEVHDLRSEHEAARNGLAAHVVRRQRGE